MSFKTLATTAVLGLATSGLVALPSTPAFADDDRKVRHGSCSQAANYTMRLRDAGDDPDRLKASLGIRSDKAGKRWTVRMYRNGNLVHRAVKRTNDNGNVVFFKRFRGDDDARVKVVARAGYGETCSRTMRLDD